MALTEIVDYQPRWPQEYELLASRLRAAVGAQVLRVDHIGSTSVPALASKDVIDLQLTVRSLEAVELREGLAAAGFRYRERASLDADHLPPGAPEDPEQWAKLYYREPDGEREVHVHVRIAGRANHRYALLFRDYLRQHPDAAELYGEFKKRLAGIGIETAVYALIKDPICDLIYRDAERWATETGWAAGAVESSTSGGRVVEGVQPPQH